MKTVLLIEDSEADRFIFKHLIKKKRPDLKVLSACNGEEAINLIKNFDKDPDLIFLDINMPQMDGHEFLKIFTENNKREIPIIVMLTSSNQNLDKDRASKYRCVKDYFLKPFTQEDIEKLDFYFKEIDTTISAEQFDC